MVQSILSGILSFVAEGVILFDAKGAITLVNPHASLLLDCTSDDLLGKNVDDMLTLAFDAGFLKPEESITHTLFSLGKIFTVPHGKVAYLTSRSGNRFPIFISARPLVLEDGKAGLLVFRDISNEKKLEQYKTNTAKRLSELTPFLQQTSTGDFSKAPEIPVEEDEFTELFVGLRLMIEDLQEAKIQREREQEERIATIRKTEEDRRRLVEEYSRQLEKSVEEKTQEIARSKTHIETIIENLTNGLLEYDNGFVLRRINRAAEILLGINRKEVIGKEILPKNIDKEHWQALIDVSYPALASASKKLKRTATELDAEINEVTISYPLERDLQVTTAPIIDLSTRKQQGFVKLLRDVTREKSISRSKSEFISIAAHQLRTPLSAIKWTLHMVMNGDEGPLNAPQLELLRNGYETNERMIQLVNDLLNVARIEEGRFGYEFKRNDILAVAKSVVDSVAAPARERRISVSVETPDGAPPPFVFDASKITLALQNLLDNAVKYTLPGGKVTVEIRTQGEYLDMRVSDTGIGVPKEQVGMLFTKFFRADNALRTQTDGSGLGLYLAKNVALRHGGSLEIESKEGVGSTFSLKLPLEEGRIPKDDASLDEV